MKQLFRRFKSNYCLPVVEANLPPFAAVRAFEAVGRLGGIRKAAASLSLNHAVVSRHLRALEAWLGVELVERGSRPVRMTEQGQQYHARISQALFEMAAATADIMPAHQREHVRVWTNGGFAAKWLGPQLIDFQAAHPDFEIDLRPTDFRPELLRNEADVDVRYHGDTYSPPPGGRGLRALELARPEIFPVANPSFAATLGAVTPTNVVSAPLLHEEGDAQWRAWLAWNGLEITDDLPGPRLWHAHLAIDAAREGRGVALVSQLIAANELAEGSLVRLEVVDGTAEPAVLGGYFFTARADRWSSPPITRLRRWFQSALKSSPES